MSRARDAYSAASVPTSSPELDPGETPERAGAPRLVSVAPLFVLALEQGAGFVPLRDGREGVHDRQRRLPDQQFATDRAREVADPHRKILWCFRFAGEPTEDGLHRAGLSSQQVVVEFVGELERLYVRGRTLAWGSTHASRQWMTD